MKKRILSILLCLVLLFAVVPIWSAPVHAATTSQNNIVDRANYLYNATWVCQRTVKGWCDRYTFYAGETHRIPYGQPVTAGAYVGFGVSVDNYLAAAANANSVFYTARSYYSGYSSNSTYYATDCSAFVSWCWGVSRKTTATIPGISSNLGYANSSNVYKLQLGDALNSNSVGHVVLVTGLSYSNGTLTQIEITEQTPPEIKRSYFSPSGLAGKYGASYTIQRYNGSVPAAPTTTGPGPVDGVYTIGTSLNSAYKLDIAGNSLESGANVHLWEQSYGDCQRFVIRKYGDYYTIRNYYTGAYLDSGGENGNVYQYQNSGEPNDWQQWKIWSNSDGTYSLSPKIDASKRLDLDNSSTTNGANIKLWENNGGGAQKWVLSAQNLLLDGIYKFASAADTNYVLDVSGGSMDNGGNVQLWERATSGSCYFVVQTSADGYCYIRAQHSNKYLDVAGGLSDSGTNVQQYDGNGTLAQKWSAIPNGDGTFSFASCGSGKYLDVKDGIGANEQNVQIWDGNGSAAQKWVPEVQRSIQDGVYHLGAHDDGNQLVEVANLETTNGSNIQLWADGGYDSSKIIIEYAGNGAYTMRSLNSQLCIEVTGASPAPGTNVQQYTPNGSDAQLWRIVPNNDGSYNIVSMINGLHLDCANGLIENGTNIQAYTPNRTNAQRFWLTPTTIGMDGVWNIAASGDESYLLDIAQESTEAGGNLVINTASGSDSQKFVVQSIYDQYYVIRNLNSGLALNVESSGAANGTNVLQWGNLSAILENEKWQIIPNADGTYSFVSTCNGLYLDLKAGNLSDGTNVQMWAGDTKEAARKWVFTEHYAVVNDGVYQFLSAKDQSFAMDVAASTEEEAMSDGANVQIYTAHTGENQKLYLRHVGNGYYTIMNMKSGKMLDVADGSGLAGANIQQYTGNGSNAQLWSILPNIDGTYTFVCKGGGKTLDIEGGTMENGTNVRTWNSNLSEAQKWHLSSTEHTHIAGEALETVAPTCTEQGYTVYVCTLCGESFRADFVEANGHTVVVDAAVAATCTEPGLTEGSHCAVCNVVLVAQEVVEATNHRLVEMETVAPTCTEDGYTKYVCEYCGESFKSDLVAATGHNYGYADNGDGTHTATCANCGDSFTEDHTFTDGTCVCGAEESTEPTVDSAISIGQQLSLESDLSLTFRIKESQLTNYDLSTAYLVVERDIYPTGGEMYVKTDMLTEYTIENSRLVFVYSGISAAQMNDEIRVTLHIKDSSGKDYVSNPLVTSVTAYAKLLLDAYGTTNAKLCTVLMDMLNYGTAAQIYFNRHADAPANTAYAEFANYASYASTDFVTPLENLSSVLTNEGATATMNLSVELATQIGIVYKVTLPSGVNAADATVVVKDADGNELETLSLANATVDSKGRYVVTYFGTPSRLMRRVVYGTVYVGGTAISNTYGYSISTYAYQIANTAGMPETLVNLTNLMVMYGDAANAYFGG